MPVPETPSSNAPVDSSAPAAPTAHSGESHQMVRGMRPAVLVPVIAVAVAVVAIAGYFLFASKAPQAPGTSQTPEPPVAPPVTETPVIIGLSFDDFRESRWRAERDIIIAEAEKLGATVIVASADGDAELQRAQAKNLMLQGAKALIVIATDSEKAAAIVEDAHQAEVKVLAYDRLIKNSDLDYYVSFDNVKVGELEARGVLDAAGGRGDFAYIGGSPTDNNAFLLREGSFAVLQPKIDAGDVRIVLDKHIENWEANHAYETMKDFLAGGGRVDGVIVANDGMAGGVIQALQEKGLAGKVFVSGQDAELLACRNLVNGTQTLTVYKPLHQLALEAVRIAVSAAKGNTVRTDSTVNNGKTDVPSRLLDVVMVTKDNLEETVIRDGLYTYAEVFGKQ